MDTWSTREKRTQNEPNQTQFQRQKMLLRMKINTRRVSFAYEADEIEAPNAYDRPANKYRGEYTALFFGYVQSAFTAWAIDFVVF